MKNLKKLSRAEMKNVTGGAGGVCNIGAICSILNGDGGETNGSCATTTNGCQCVTSSGEDFSSICSSN